MQNDDGPQDSQPPKSSSFSNPICQETYESLPRIYGTLKKRIEANKSRFYENMHKRVQSNIVKKEDKTDNRSSEAEMDLLKHLKKIKEQDHVYPTGQDVVVENERPTAKFSDKYHKLSEKSVSIPKQKKQSYSKQQRKHDRQTSHKVKFNTLHFLPALQQGNLISSQNDNFDSLVKENSSKSVMVNNPLVNLYRSREVERERSRMVTHEIEEENSENQSTQRVKVVDRYVPKGISQSLAREKEKKSGLRIQTDCSLHGQETAGIRKGNGVPTEFSRRIHTQKSHSNYLSDSRGTHKYKVPLKDDYKDFIQQYKPISPAFSLKTLILKPNFQIVAYSNAVYFGEVVNKVRKGSGVLVAEDSIFEGVFDNDEKYKGFEQNVDGVYVGYFKKGQREGRGQFSWHNGEVFEGEWRAGKKNGTGIWTSPSGDRYEGEWLNGRQHGTGTHKHKNSTYKGEFHHSLKHGSGEQIFLNGDRYKGFYEKGKPHGLGRYDWSDGSYYEGEFREGYREGKGTLSEKNGCYYKVKVLSRGILSTVLGKKLRSRARSSRDSSRTGHGCTKNHSNSELMFSQSKQYHAAIRRTSNIMSSLSLTGYLSNYTVY